MCGTNRWLPKEGVMVSDLALPGVSVVVLAAGMGTRMKSDIPKALHAVAGRPMVNHVLAAAAAVVPERVIVVTGPGDQRMAEAVRPARVAVQEKALGTADAVKAARDALAGFGETGETADVVVLFGDAPTIQGRAIHDLVQARREAGAVASVLGVHVTSCNRYGRLVLAPDGSLERIVEYHDATDEERASTLCNSGMMSIDAGLILELVDEVSNRNSKREFYLSDIVAIARARGMKTAVLQTEDPDDTVGADDRIDLARFEAVLQHRLRLTAMAEGCSMIAPETVWLSWDTEIGRDVRIEPNVVIGPGVVIGDDAVIMSFSHLEGCRIEQGAAVGPFARVRPGSRLGEGAKIGNFVEIKASSLGPGVKANHLAYVGDAEVGAHANLGAGVVICNYDGVSKHPTRIGERAFIGSNSSLVAPLSIGNDTIVGAGSTITRDVGDDALALERTPQMVSPGVAKRLRRKKAAQRYGRGD